MKCLLFLFLCLCGTVCLSAEEEVCLAGDDSESCKSKSQSEKKTEKSFGARLLEQFEENLKKKPEIFANSGDTAQGIRIENPNARKYDIYWYDHDRQKGIYTGTIRKKGVKSTNSYIGHTFYITNEGESEELWRFNVEKNKGMYIIPPDDPSANNVRYQELLVEQEFLETYLEENGQPWLAYYPRDPPILPMWPAQHVGQIHKVTTQHTHWYCRRDTVDSVIENYTICDWMQEDSSEGYEYEIEVMSLKPKVYVIQNLIGHDEADLIIQMSKTRVERSLAGTDGGYVSESRTSQTTWLEPTEHQVLDTIYKRAADVLRLPPEMMDNNKNAESLQVVRYGPGQQYQSHYDFGADGRPQTRFITLLFYLNDQKHRYAGGETGFPKANDGKGLAIHPGKGNSILFYSLLEDGNADDYSLHAGTPVIEGEKWICNFWVWDPHR